MLLEDVEYKMGGLNSQLSSSLLLYSTMRRKGKELMQTYIWRQTNRNLCHPGLLTVLTEGKMYEKNCPGREKLEYVDQGCRMR